MNKFIKLSLTVLILGIGNWITAIVFDINSIDVSIPFAVASIFIIYIFTNKGGATGRIMDMQIQGQTGIRMGFANRVTSTSYIFLAALIYFLVALFVTFFTYKDYFIN